MYESKYPWALSNSSSLSARYPVARDSSAAISLSSHFTLEWTPSLRTALPLGTPNQLSLKNNRYCCTVSRYLNQLSFHSSPTHDNDFYPRFTLRNRGPKQNTTRTTRRSSKRVHARASEGFPGWHVYAARGVASETRCAALNSNPRVDR